VRPATSVEAFITSASREAFVGNVGDDEVCEASRFVQVAQATLDLAETAGAVVHHGQVHVAVGYDGEVFEVLQKHSESAKPKYNKTMNIGILGNCVAA